MTHAAAGPHSVCPHKLSHNKGIRVSLCTCVCVCVCFFSPAQLLECLFYLFYRLYRAREARLLSMLGPFSLVLFLQNDQFHPHTPARNPNTTSSFLLFFFILQSRKLKTLVNYFLRRKWTSAQSTGCLKTLLKLPQRRLVCVPVGSCEWNAAVHTAVHVRVGCPRTSPVPDQSERNLFSESCCHSICFFPFSHLFFFRAASV